MIWQTEVLEHIVSLQAVFEHHMPKIKSTQSAQTLGAWFPPTSESQLSEQFDRIHAIHSIIISCSWTLTSLSHAIIWQVRNGAERQNTKTRERETQRQQREREKRERERESRERETEHKDNRGRERERERDRTKERREREREERERERTQRQQRERERERERREEW